MAARLPKDAGEKIGREIAALPAEPAPTWEDVKKIAAKICMREVSRQWLWKSNEVRNAFEDKKNKKATASPTTPLQKALATIRDLRDQLSARDAVLDRYHERLASILLRAREKGLTQEELEVPLIKIIRGGAGGLRHKKFTKGRR